MSYECDTTPRLRMEGVCKRFGATIALNEVHLEVAPGEVLALVGENGAGKSTLMKILSGAYLPDKGKMWLDGVAYQPPTPHAARLSGVGMIYQELSLVPHLTVAENIVLGMEPVTGGFIRRHEMRKRAQDALEQLGHPDIQPDMRVNQLPISSRQLVEIARAIASGCRVMVLDEPTSSLSEADTLKLFKLIHRLRQQGKSIIYISHMLEEVMEIADRYTVLRDGETVGSGSITSTTTTELIGLMVGREVANLYPRSPRTPGELLMDIDCLAGALLPRSATLKLHRGEILGIAGLVGAGRTELLRTIFGLGTMHGGRIQIGAYVGTASPAQRWKQGVGMVSEDRKIEGLALKQSIADNLTLSRLTGFGPYNFVLPNRIDAAAGQWIERLGIKCRAPQQAVGNLSGGNQQKVAIARLLQHDVDILLLDEPTRGIDVGAKAQIYTLLDELASGDATSDRPPKAILIVSSYLPELFGICDRIAVMCRGKLGKIIDVSKTDEHQIMREASGTES